MHSYFSRPNRAFVIAVKLSLYSLILIALQCSVRGAELPKYYAHQTVVDKYGVIAPWYHGINGQCDFRVRIAAETLKRYPWTEISNATASCPDYIFSDAWRIDANGKITPTDVRII